MYSTSKPCADQPVSLDPAVLQCSLEKEQELTKEPIHIIKLGPHTDVIEILGSRLVTHELLVLWDSGPFQVGPNVVFACQGEVSCRGAAGRVQQSLCGADGHNNTEEENHPLPLASSFLHFFSSSLREFDCPFRESKATRDAARGIESYGTWKEVQRK